MEKGKGFYDNRRDRNFVSMMKIFIVDERRKILRLYGMGYLISYFLATSW